MRGKIIILITMIMLLSGCSSASQELILTDSSEQAESGAAYLTLSEETSGGETESDANVSEQAKREAEKGIFIYVCGAVNNPGVYELPAGCRVIDAVNSAGGLSDEADSTYVNLAAQLEDGLKLCIPTISETSDSEDKSQNVRLSNHESAEIEVLTKAVMGADAADNSGGLVNINTASVDQLKTLPGIGDGIAGRIVDYRTECGGFTCIEDIMKISGIKDKLFQKIKDHITV